MSTSLDSFARQRGVVLIVGLVILLVLSLLALGSMRATTLEERMSNNTQDQQIAFQVAEAALREGELIVQQPMLPAFLAVDDAAADGFYLFDPPDGDSPQTPYKPLWRRSADDAGAPVWRDSEITEDAPPAPLDLARGQYLIEQLLVREELSPGESLQADTAADRRERIIYRITARAWGPTGQAQPAPMVILQSTFLR